MRPVAERIWNRACALEPRDSDRVGDRALAAMILFHSLAMNGGVLSALEEVDEDELRAAIAGYAWFGFCAFEPMLHNIRARAVAAEGDSEAFDEAAAAELESWADSAYEAVIADDDALSAAFERELARRPEEFAPVI